MRPLLALSVLLPAAGCAPLGLGGPGTASLKDPGMISGKEESRLAKSAAQSSTRYQPSRRLLHAAKSAAVVSFLVLPDSKLQVDRQTPLLSLGSKTVTFTRWTEFPEDFTKALASRMLEAFLREFGASGLRFMPMEQVVQNPYYASLPYSDRQASKEVADAGRGGYFGKNYHGLALAAPGTKFIVPNLPTMSWLPWGRSGTELAYRDRSMSDVFTRKGWRKALGSEFKDIAAALDVDLVFCVVNLVRDRDTHPSVDRVEVYAYSRSRSAKVAWTAVPVWSGATKKAFGCPSAIVADEDAYSFWQKLSDTYGLALRLLARRFEADYAKPVAEAPFPAEEKARETLAAGRFGAVLKYAVPAAQSGHPVAQELLARMYSEGAGVPQDDAEAAYWARKSAEQGDGKAACLLASMLQTGRGVATDPAEAHKWAAAAVERGEAACGGLRDELLGSVSARQETDAAKEAWAALDAGKAAEALRLAEPAARAGDASAQALMGRLFAEGKAAPRDPETAFRWSLQAAEHGHVGAQCRVGAMYLEGKGVPMNLREAELWLRRARDGGDREAMKLLDGMADWRRVRESVDGLPDR